MNLNKTLPNHWFKPVCELIYICSEPDKIEYLKMWSGETFIHTCGTVFYKNGYFDVESIMRSGITHYRIIN